MKSIFFTFLTFIFGMLAIAQQLPENKDTLYLNNGKILIGRVTAISEDEILFLTGSGWRTDSRTIQRDRINHTGCTTHIEFLPDVERKISSVRTKEDIRNVEANKVRLLSQSWHTGTSFQIVGLTLVAGGLYISTDGSNSLKNGNNESLGQKLIIAGGIAMFIGTIISSKNTSDGKKTGRFRNRNKLGIICPGEMPGIGLSFTLN